MLLSVYFLYKSHGWCKKRSIEYNPLPKMKTEILFVILMFSTKSFVISVSSSTLIILYGWYCDLLQVLLFYVPALLRVNYPQ